MPTVKMGVLKDPQTVRLMGVFSECLEDFGRLGIMCVRGGSGQKKIHLRIIFV